MHFRACGFLLSLVLLVVTLPAAPSNAHPVLSPRAGVNILGSFRPHDLINSIPRLFSTWRGSNAGRVPGRGRRDRDRDRDSPDEPSEYRADLEAADFVNAPDKRKKNRDSPDGPDCPTGKHCYGSCCERTERCVPMALRILPRYHQCCDRGEVADHRGKCCSLADFQKDRNGICG